MWIGALAFAILVLLHRNGNELGRGARILLATNSGDEYVESLHNTIAMLQEKLAALEKQHGKAPAKTNSKDVKTKATTVASPVANKIAQSSLSKGAHVFPSAAANITHTNHSAKAINPEKLVQKAVKAEKSMAKMVGLDATSLLSLSMFTDWSNRKESKTSRGKNAVVQIPAAPTVQKSVTPILPSKPSETVTGLESPPYQVGHNPALDAVPGPRGNFSFNPQSDHKGPFFYMYSLPEEFWWRWPAPGSDCSENGYVGHEHAQLSGMGPPVLPADGLFLTWHFSLFSSLFNRLKRSKRRTLDPEKASLFIIPYDLGLDGYLDSRTCRNSRRCTAGMPQRLQEIILQQPYFYRNMGADHAVLWSLGQYHPWPHNGCDLFMRDFCAKCSFTCYWMDPQKAENRFISVPFPSGYHWWEGIQSLPWQYDAASAKNRTMTAVYVGSTQTLNPAHTKIRRAMTTQCNASAECHWMQIAHTSKDNNIADFLSVYKKAKFCLCPPGDDPARKAVFDSILSGCIPVIFEVATLFNQYPWHIGEQAALDIAVSFPGGLVRSGKLDFMSILTKIPPETIRAKQLAIARLAPRIQYAMPPLKLLENRSDETPWDPPFVDGVEVTLDGLFLRTSKAVTNASTGIPPRLQTNREWGQEYDVVKVKVPGSDSRTDNAVQLDGVGIGGGKGGKGGHLGKNHRAKGSGIGEGKRGARGERAPDALGAPNEEEG